MEIVEKLYINDVKELLFKYDELLKHLEIMNKLQDLERKLANNINEINRKVEKYRKDFEDQIDDLKRDIRTVESYID
jgi:uncharacterized protein YlxW (UPF0749 family)